MPQLVRAVVVDPAAPGRLAIREVGLRDPDRDEVGVRVTAISLNRGETRRALQTAEPGWRPGWDFAGIVETGAADSSEAICWRLITTLPAGALAAAQEIVQIYRLRWRIEHTFRACETDGLGLPELQTHNADRLFKIAALALGAVRTIQLVDARNGRRLPRQRCGRPGDPGSRGGDRANPGGPGHRGSKTPTRRARCRGWPGLSCDWAVETATTSRPDPRPCARVGTDSPRWPADITWQPR